MFEILFLIGVLAVGGAILIGILKLLVAIALIPFKLAFWLVKGVLAVVLFIPLVIIGLNVFALGIPIVLFLLFLPLLLGIVGLVLLVRLIF